MIRPGLICSLAALTLASAATSMAAEKDTRVYEMRIYYAAPDKLDALHARFRDHTIKLFEKHGMTNLGYWVPMENKENKLIYVLSYPSMDDRKKSWAGFIADPDWKKAYSESEKNGKLVSKIEQYYMSAMDYSPAVKVAANDPQRVFELRTYTASAGNLGNLNARFRNHTVKLFEKHGMTNLWYWNLAEGQKNADNTLVYILAHKSADSHKKSFDSFRADPDWVAARTESEKKAGGSLTEKDGVKSVLMKPTDYSPIK